MTLYRIYAENGNRAGFWVQHRSWTNMCAHVDAIAGQADGTLPAPTMDADNVSINAFDVRSGRPVNLGPPPDYRVDRNYTRIAEPFWSHGLEKGRAHLPRMARR